MNDAVESSRPRTRRTRRRGVRGFTLIEALAALLLVAIVLPVVMRGVSVGTASASHSRRRTEAASLAQSKMAELIATETWKSGALAGYFDLLQGDTAPEYAWRAEVRSWNEPFVKQLDVYVTWTAGGGEQFVTLSTLVYEGRPKEEDEQTGTGTGSGTDATGGGT